MKNYIQNSEAEITRLDGNDSLTHKEKFFINRNGKTDEINFYHSKTLPKSKILNFNYFEENPIEHQHSNWFNHFINKNERFVKEKSVTIDIGANDGDTSLAINYLSNGGKTYAFECGPAYTTNLLVNLESNKRFDIVPIPFAVMPENGIHEFLYCPWDYNGGASVTNSHVGNIFQQKRLAAGINFYDFIKDYKVDVNKIDFIKVDTEGHDFHILWSIRELIKEIKPVIHAEWFPGTSPFLAELLKEINYFMYSEVTLERITVNSPWTQDIVLIHADKIKNYDLK